MYTRLFPLSLHNFINIYYKKMDNNHLNMFFLLLFIISLFPDLSSSSKLTIAKSMTNLKQTNTNSTNVNVNPNNVNISPNNFFKIFGPCLPKNCQGPYAFCVNPTICEYK